MLRRLLLVVVMMASSASADIVLQVDFSSLTQDGGPHNQEGWSAYAAGHEVAADFITANYGGITVTPAWPNTTDNRVQQSIDRAPDNDATWNDAAGDIDLVTDWIGIDTRTGNGGNGNWDGITGTPTYMTLTLGGLAAGNYEWTSFHHDTEHCHGPFAVWLSTDGGGTFTQLADGLMTDGTAGGTPDSGAIEGGPDAYSLPSTYRTSFGANGTDDVVFRFAIYSTAAGVHRQIWGMNGFELETFVLTEASQPSPGNGAPDVPRDGTVLSWVPGESADKHDVYFGTDFDDVNDASVSSDPAGVYEGRQDQASYPLGRLEFGETYFWRVDSVEVDGTTIYKGVVWSFTAEPAGYPVAAADITVTASSETTGYEAVNTVNESGLDDTGRVHSTEMGDMWLSSGADADAVWIQYEFDKVYKLYQMLVWNHNSFLEPTIGFGVKDATVAYSTDGVNWSSFDTQFAQAPGAAGYEADRVELDGATARYVKITAHSAWKNATTYGLSEVRFLYVPVWAREPDPGPGAANVDVGDVILSWRAGREAALHNLYLSTSWRAVEDGTALVQSTSQTSYDAGEVQLGQTYYWKIVEANDAETPTAWEGDVWDFTTREFLVVDNFETYNDDYENYNRIFQVWIDGAGYTQPAPGRTGNGSGSLVGTDEAPWVEQTIVHSGRQSMPLGYNNMSTPFYSEATRTFDTPQDWAMSGIQALTLWFHGDPNNEVTDRMYVKVNGSKVPYDGDAYSITRTAWKEWNIDLRAFTDVDLGNVTEVSVGLERSGVVGGEGTVYFDDIRLYPARCLPSLLKPDADFNGDCEVDFADYEMMANQWLTSGLLVTPEQPSAASLVAHYEFEGTANDSAGTNNGVTTGGPTYIDGVVGQAINFDGFNDYMFVAGPFELPAYTMTVWFRSDGGTGNRDLLSAYSPGVLHGILLELQGAGTLRYLHRCPLGSNAAADNSNVYSSGTYDDGDWHHAAIVKLPTDIVLYVDGDNEGSVPAVCDFGPADALGLAIGILDNEREAARLFVGPMDDVRIYSRTLSHAEAAGLAGRTEPFSAAFDLSVDGSVGFADIEALADEWLDQQLWPAP